MLHATTCRRCGRLLSEFILIEIVIGAGCLECLGDYAPRADAFGDRQLRLPFSCSELL